jgi:hypothetical protein
MFNRISAWMKGSDTGLRLPWRMFWVGFAVRVLYITLAHSYHIRLQQDHFQFGWEIGRISRALATGYGYADPFVGHSGPTAWSPPLFPFLLAGVFKLFGVYTPLSAWVILTIDSVFSAAIAPAICEIAYRCYDANSNSLRRVSLWSGWLWALYPAACQYAVHWVWEMSITACLFAWVWVIALRVRGIGDHRPPAVPGLSFSLANPTTGAERDPQTAIRWAVFGVLWALIFLCNSTLVLFLPVCGLWMLLGPRKEGTTSPLLPWILKAALAAVLFLACTAPWVYRNWVVFHAFIPSRGNLGAELYQSVLPENNGFPWGITVSHYVADPEYQSYKALGEVAYVQQKNDLAHALIRFNPHRFVSYVLKRVFFFWVSVPHPIEKGWIGWVVELGREIDFCFLSLAGVMGLALSIRRRTPATWLFAWAFVLLPIPYYFITSGARFRHPLEPLICILTVYLFQSTTPRSHLMKTPLKENI